MSRRNSDGAPLRIALPIAQWPAGDRVAWLASASAAGSMTSAAWAESTRASIRAAYARWLMWLKENWPKAFRGGRGGRMEADIVRDYVLDLRKDLAASSIVTALIQIRSVFRILQSGWNEPWMETLIRRIRRDLRDTRRKRERIVPSSDLLLFGWELLNTARDGGTLPPDLDRARQYRDGLAIALLALRPLRLANFLGLRLRSSVTDRRGAVWLDVPGEQTKTGLPLLLPVPSQLRAKLAFYLRVIRPTLAVGYENSKTVVRSDALWLSTGGRPWSRNGFYAMICRRTAARFGEPVNPHLFRDCLATSIAGGRPDLSWTIPLVLGHASQASSRKFYIHLSEAAALETFSRHLEKLRRKAWQR
jgi:integrase/recombinase XerD